MEKDTNSLSQKNRSIAGAFINGEFVASIIIPIVLYWYFDRIHMTLTGTVLAGGWSIVVLAYGYMKERKFNLFAGISAGFSAIGVIGALLSRNPDFFLVSPIVTDLLMAVVFIGTAVAGKPLILSMALYQMGERIPEKTRNNKNFINAFKIVTIAWGLLSISQAILRIILLHSVDRSTYFAISSAYGNISTPVLLLLSFWFPKYYMRLKRKSAAV